METTLDFLTETACRSFWHSLLDQMGLEKLLERCRVKRITNDNVDFFRVTIKAD